MRRGHLRAPPSLRGPQVDGPALRLRPFRGPEEVGALLVRPSARTCSGAHLVLSCKHAPRSHAFSGS
eukprot:8990846-Alexandrium_andersonii.AAC.1